MRIVFYNIKPNADRCFTDKLLIFGLKLIYFLIKLKEE